MVLDYEQSLVFLRNRVGECEITSHFSRLLASRLLAGGHFLALRPLHPWEKWGTARSLPWYQTERIPFFFLVLNLIEVRLSFATLWLNFIEKEYKKEGKKTWDQEYDSSCNTNQSVWRRWKKIHNLFHVNCYIFYNIKFIVINKLKVHLKRWRRFEYLSSEINSFVDRRAWGEKTKRAAIFPVGVFASRSTV